MNGPEQTPADELPLVLVADDNEDIRRFICLALTRVGYEVVEAQDGREALELARTRHPALAVLDVMMPELDGCEVTETLRASPITRDIRVILLSGRAQAPDVARGMAAGADSYLIKPVSVDALRDGVRRVLGTLPSA